MPFLQVNECRPFSPYFVSLWFYSSYFSVTFPWDFFIHAEKTPSPSFSFLEAHCAYESRQLNRQ